jgi:hypothetical protein
MSADGPSAAGFILGAIGTGLGAVIAYGKHYSTRVVPCGECHGRFDVGASVCPHCSTRVHNPLDPAPPP